MDNRPPAERSADDTFEADPETETMLLEAIAQCERGQTTPLSEGMSRPLLKLGGGSVEILRDIHR